MRKYNILSCILLSLFFVFTFSVTAYANSSWRWISETRPHDILPLVIILTLIIELFCIYIICKTKNILKTFFFVVIANIFSFAAPYLFLYIIPSLYTFEQTLEHSPFYIVGIGYLLVTLAVEIPIVYFSLAKTTHNVKNLLFTIIGANILTTTLTAIIERVFCKGSW